MGAGTYQVGDRRPLVSRQTRWAARATSLLVRLGVSPNAISLAGVAFGCAAGGLLAATPWVGPVTRRICFLAVAGAVQLRLMCNLLDGMVAVESHRASRTGELFNEIPDRISDPATLIGAGYAVGGSPVLGFVAACLALFTAYIRAVGKVAGAAQEFCGPMAKQQRMFVITVACIYCALAPAKWQPLWGEFGWGAMAMALLLITLGCIVTVIRRLARITQTLGAANP
jgi:phosphatidylglycerophosphate synthase